VLDTTVSPAKMDKLIETPFGLWTHVGLRNHVLAGGLDLPEGGAILKVFETIGIMYYCENHCVFI